MVGETPNPALRARIETAIRIASPVLDLVIALGDRVSRIFDRGEPNPPLVRMPSEGEHAPRGLRQRERSGQ